jgi:hypothetical protein
MNDAKVKDAIDDFHDEAGLFYQAENGSREERMMSERRDLSRKRLEAAIDDLVARIRTTECAEAAKLAKQNKEKP